MQSVEGLNGVRACSSCLTVSEWGLFPAFGLTMETSALHGLRASGLGTKLSALSNLRLAAAPNTSEDLPVPVST